MSILTEKECAACGAFFQPERGNQVYCPQCREATGGKCYRMKIRYDRASENVGRRFSGLDMVPVRFTCRQCGEEFEYYVDKRDVETTHKDFCSAKCSSLYRIAHTACTWCGKMMTDTEDVRDTNGHAWYCSDVCREKMAWKEAEETGEIGTCPVCGKVFLNKGHKKTYCSRVCYMESVQAKKGMVYTVPCRLCGAAVQVKYDPAQLKRKAAGERCKACRQKCVEEAAHERIQMEDQAKADRDKAGRAKELAYLMANGLCSVCTTSYTKCERMQTEFRVSPEGIRYKNSKVIRCPKFAAKLKYHDPMQFRDVTVDKKKDQEVPA